MQSYQPADGGVVEIRPELRDAFEVSWRVCCSCAPAPAPLQVVDRCGQLRCFSCDTPLIHRRRVEAEAG